MSLPSGKLIVYYGKSPDFTGKLTMSITMLSSSQALKSPEGQSWVPTIYVLVICYIAIENYHLIRVEWIFPLTLVIFHSYVSHYQRVKHHSIPLNQHVPMVFPWLALKKKTGGRPFSPVPPTIAPSTTQAESHTRPPRPIAETSCPRDKSLTMDFHGKIGNGSKLWNQMIHRNGYI